MIEKSAESEFTLYSLTTGAVTEEPATDSWDFRFTKYTHQFVDPPIAYLVTGLVLNSYQTAAAEFSEKPFDEITAIDTAMVEWSHTPDMIGYDWKFYDFDTGTYQVDSDRSWIIRNQKGFYYKLRFTGFYDENGNVGTPKFEYVLL